MADKVTLYAQRAGETTWTPVTSSDLAFCTQYAAAITVDDIEGELTPLPFPVTTPAAQEEAAVAEADAPPADDVAEPIENSD